MSAKTVPGHIVNEVARDLDTDNEGAARVLASISREGADTALRRFPFMGNRSVLLRIAATLHERDMIDVPDIRQVRLDTCGLKWSIMPPAGLDQFNVAFHDRDPRLVQVRTHFVCNDIAHGVGRIIYQPSDLEERIAADPVLRVKVVRQIRHMAICYLAQAITNSDAPSGLFRKNMKDWIDAAMSESTLIPVVNLVPRFLPHFNDSDHFNVSVDVTCTYVFEMQIKGRSGDQWFEGVEVKDEGAYFEIAGGAETLERAAGKLKGKARKKVKKLAKGIKAISPQNRRRREKEVIQEGPDETLHREMVEIGDEKEPTTVEITGPATKIQKMEASLSGDIKKSYKWWKRHRGLIKPTLNELATKAIGSFGPEYVQRKDIETLIDLALPSLQKIAKKRQSQFTDFGVDAAVVGLGNLLREEIKKRIR